MTLTERASRYVAALPAAISGVRGHDALFRVACVLVNGFALSDKQAWPIILGYSAKCEPPWNERELRHKLAQARKVQHRDPRGYLLGTRNHLITSAPPRVIGRITLPDGPPITESETAMASVADDNEARRIADELLKLHRDGAISGPHDPQARFYASLVHLFGATYSVRSEP